MATWVEVMKAPSKLIVIAVACTLFPVPLSGCLDDGDEDDNGEEPLENYERFYSVDRNGTKAWHIIYYAGINVEKGKELFWKDMIVILESPDGSSALEERPEPWTVEPDEGFHVFYEINDRRNERTEPYNITPADRIRLVGVTAEYLGGKVTLEVGDETIEEYQLPDQLVEDVEMDLEEDRLWYNLWNYSLSWNLILDPRITAEPTFPLYWELLTAGIVDGNGEFLVGPTAFRPDRRGVSREDLNEGMEVEFRYDDDRWEDWTDYVLGPGRLRYLGALSERDEIMVAGITRDLIGGRVVIFKGLDMIAESAPIGQLGSPFSNVTLDTPDVRTEVTNESMYHSAHVEVLDFDLANDTNYVLWSTARVLITDTDGAVLANLSVSETDPGDHCNTLMACSDYDIDEGDDLHGLDLSFRGANLELFLSGVSVENVTFPDEFDITGIEVGTSYGKPDKRTVGEDEVYDVVVRAWSKRPLDGTIPWDQMRARIVNRTSDTVLLDLARPATYEGSLADEPRTYVQVIEDVNITKWSQARFHISALDASFEDSCLELFMGDEMVGWELLAAPFNRSSPTATIELSSPTVIGTDINSTPYYKVILNVNKVLPKDGTVYWVDIRVKVLAANGSLLVPFITPLLDIGTYDEDDTDGIDVGIWYIEIQSDGKLGAGDAFLLTGLTKDYEGARFQLFYYGTLSGAITLPTEFP